MGTALPCRRRPANRICLGRIIVFWTQPEQPIDWCCSRCGDDGTISNWTESIYDLRLQRLSAAESVCDIIVTADIAAALRTLPFLDKDCRRAVFAIRAYNDSRQLALTNTEFDELISAPAAAKPTTSPTGGANDYSTPPMTTSPPPPANPTGYHDGTAWI